MTARSRAAALMSVLIAAGVDAMSADQGAARPRCLMQAPPAVYALPPSGFSDGDEPNKQRACDAVSGDWLRGALSAGELAVNPAGPEGTGRYWTITVGLSATRGATPTRGVCISTNTAGWRSLRSFGPQGLPWVADRNGDNQAELVLWTSFFLTPRLVQYETGLVAWVYRVEAKTGRLLLDLPLSRRMAEEIATAYKQALSDKEVAAAPTLPEERRLAAAALDALAADRCGLPQENRR
jgi:hypothetical protein